MCRRRENERNGMEEEEGRGRWMREEVGGGEKSRVTTKE